MNKGITQYFKKCAQAHSLVQHNSDTVSAVKRILQEAEPISGKERRGFLFWFFFLVTYHEHLLELKGKFLINQIYDLFNVQAFAKSECKVLRS